MRIAKIIFFGICPKFCLKKIRLSKVFLLSLPEQKEERKKFLYTSGLSNKKKSKIIAFFTEGSNVSKPSKVAFGSASWISMEAI